MTMKIENNIKTVNKNTLFMSKQIAKANRFALNDAAKQGRTSGRKAIRDIYNIKASAVRKSENIIRATRSKLVATLEYSSSRRNLISYGARQLKAGTRVKVLKAGGFKTIKHAFIQTAHGGRAVMTRRVVGGARVGRYKTSSRSGPSQSEMANRPAVSAIIMKKANSVFDRRQLHHIDRVKKQIRRTRG